MKKIRDNLPKLQIAAGDNHTLILTEDGSLWVCGDNKFGQLGLKDKINRLTFTLCPIELEKNESIVQLIASDSDSLVLTSTNRLLGCGNGVVKNVFTPFSIELEENEGIDQVVLGAQHTLVLTSTGRLLGYGSNFNGQRGGNAGRISNFTPCPIEFEKNERIVQLAAGAYHSIVLTSAGRLLGCGTGVQLGLGDSSNIETFTLCTIELEENESIIHVIAKQFQSFVLTSTGRLLGSGRNTNSQLGFKSTSMMINTFTPCLIELDENEVIVQLVTGLKHSLILTNTGRLFGSGLNNVGQLGFGKIIISATFVPCPIRLEKNEVIVQLAAGNTHSFVTTSLGRLLGCGRTCSGQLGFISDKDILTFTPCPISPHHLNAPTRTKPIIEETDTGEFFVK